MRPFHPGCGGGGRSSSRPESVGQAGGVKIIDTFVPTTLAALQVRGLKPLNEQSNLALTGV
jgi:hypothetical protein